MTLRKMLADARRGRSTGNYTLMQAATDRGFDPDNPEHTEPFLNAFAAEAIATINTWDGKQIMDATHPMLESRRKAAWLIGIGATAQVDAIKAAVAAVTKQHAPGGS